MPRAIIENPEKVDELAKTYALRGRRGATMYVHVNTRAKVGETIVLQPWGVNLVLKRFGAGGGRPVVEITAGEWLDWRGLAAIMPRG